MSVRSSIAVLAVLAVVGLLTFGLVSKGSSGVQLGETAPDPAMPRLEGGGEQTLSDYRGRWVLVNFWASWCDPCRDEAPELEAFQRQHGGKDFTMVGIATRDLTDDGIAFVDRYGLSYPQLRDGSGEVANDFGNRGVPENFLLDPQGRIQWLFRGPITGEHLRDEVAPLIEGKRS